MENHSFTHQVRGRGYPAVRARTADGPVAISHGSETPNLRRVIVDLIEEYARHTGRADLIRASIDGRVGEDAPR